MAASAADEAAAAEPAKPPHLDDRGVADAVQRDDRVATRAEAPLLRMHAHVTSSAVKHSYSSAASAVQSRFAAAAEAAVRWTAYLWDQRTVHCFETDREQMPMMRD